MEFDLENRWTAALVKEEGEWKLAAYHVSANVLDNAVLDIAKRGVLTSNVCIVTNAGFASTLGKLAGNQRVISAVGGAVPHRELAEHVATVDGVDGARLLVRRRVPGRAAPDGAIDAFTALIST